MINAVFFDVDGTLKQHHGGGMSDRTRKSLHKLRQKGIKLFVATGRTPFLFEKVRDRLGFEFDGYIYLNGQYVEIDGTVVHDMPIPVPEIEKITAYLNEKNIPCEMAETDYQYRIFDSAAQYNPTIKVTEMNLSSNPDTPVESIQRIYNNKTYQISLFINKKEEAELISHMPELTMARWSENFTDIIPAGGGKSVGIAKLLSHIGIAPENAMAFGDGENDIDMLEFVKIGVAMGNANDIVKAAADYVTLPVLEDGIENALKHFKMID